MFVSTLALTLGRGAHVSIASGRASCIARHGLHVNDVTIPTAPLTLETMTLVWPDEPEDLAGVGDDTYIVDRDRLRGFDVSNPAHRSMPAVVKPGTSRNLLPWETTCSARPSGMEY
jgi:hypothetical protein